jgi:uncharacterized protein with GYD domain
LSRESEIASSEEGIGMETYVSLFKGKGKRGATELGRKALESVGCRQIASYVLMGQYDVLVIFEAPDAASAAAGVWKAREAASEGESRSETMRAFTEKEMEKLAELIGRGA